MTVGSIAIGVGFRSYLKQFLIFVNEAEGKIANVLLVIFLVILLGLLLMLQIDTLKEKAFHFIQELSQMT